MSWTGSSSGPCRRRDGGGDYCCRRRSGRCHGGGARRANDRCPCCDDHRTLTLTVVVVRLGALSILIRHVELPSSKPSTHSRGSASCSRDLVCRHWQSLTFTEWLLSDNCCFPCHQRVLVLFFLPFNSVSSIPSSPPRGNIGMERVLVAAA